MIFRSLQDILTGVSALRHLSKKSRSCINQNRSPALCGKYKHQVAYHYFELRYDKGTSKGQWKIVKRQVVLIVQ
jgi:hypothetical protein